MSVIAGLVVATQILYIRHGEVPGNDPSPETYIYTGSGTNDSLTERGVLQAEECAKKITDFCKRGAVGKVTAIYTSNLKRAVETGRPIAKALGLEAQQNPDLREIFWGDADGQLVAKVSQTYAEAEKAVKQRYPERKIRWDHLPVFKDAEKYNALLKRSVDTLSSIAEMHPNETIIIVGHGRVLKTLIADAYDNEENIPYPANCGIAEFRYSTEEGLRFLKVMQEPLPSKL